MIRAGGSLLVKRAGKDAAGNWLMVSDHPSWPPAPWPADARGRRRGEVDGQDVVSG